MQTLTKLGSAVSTQSHNIAHGHAHRALGTVVEIRTTQVLTLTDW